MISSLATSLLFFIIHTFLIWIICGCISCIWSLIGDVITNERPILDPIDSKERREYYIIICLGVIALLVISLGTIVDYIDRRSQLKKLREKTEWWKL